MSYAGKSGRPKFGPNGQPVRQRYCVEAIFDDQTTVVLRDFYYVGQAQAFARSLENRDLYPTRSYRVRVVQRWIEVSHD